MNINKKIDYRRHIIQIIIVEAVFLVALYSLILFMGQEKLPQNIIIGAVFVAIFIVLGATYSLELRKERNEHLRYSHINEHNEKLEYLADHDILTGLPNRAYFEKIIPLKLSEAELMSDKVAVLFVGIDNFKKINDTLGHATGDAVIKEVAKRLFACSQKNFEVMRFGGDEFVLVISNNEDLSAVERAVNQIRTLFEQSFEVNKREIHLTASMGYSIYPDQTEEGKNLLQYADIAMFHAKVSGKNSVLMFEPGMNNDMQNRMILEEKMRTCIKNNGFEMYYQPQYDFYQNKFRGFEALIRWYDDDLGWISPAVFIPIAEENGDILEIGEWVLKEVCRTWVSWKKVYGHMGIVSVNVSGAQIVKPGFVNLVRSVIDAYKMNPRELELEITESVFINDIDSIMDTLNELKEIGVSLSLDDFGTGYSSLTYLKDLPIDTLKIDKSFINDITENNRQAEITDALIELVHKLNMETIAEGVETKEQYDFLRYMKCDNIQGYYTGRPMNEQAAGELIKTKCCA
ncbi:putative bifunctional diguanylate cyclase/phosphodiesterase [Konateibacter massiliensis]|uniref:putative bifunctional diguanylate cyclase/phosphodiesterase n=1 Tax=Konateibacter massiliensis TaxID=2002841 RepID=UPI0015D50814|nr:GGDEF domain-containing phosphodiesterase [Konateibacter massiliensis]